MSRFRVAVEQIRFARQYTARILDTIPAADWFRVPPGGVSLVAWQVGHLAMAEYRLAMERIRDTRPGDAELIGPDFLQAFGRGSVPTPELAGRYDADTIRGVFDRVHARALEELAATDEGVLDGPVFKPHPIAATRFEALMWCGQHELTHAGQLGLLRRQLGQGPLW